MKRSKENLEAYKILTTRKGGPMKDKRKPNRKKIKETLKNLED